MSGNKGRHQQLCETQFEPPVSHADPERSTEALSYADSKMRGDKCQITATTVRDMAYLISGTLISSLVLIQLGLGCQFDRQGLVRQQGSGVFKFLTSQSPQPNDLFVQFTRESCMIDNGHFVTANCTTLGYL